MIDDDPNSSIVAFTCSSAPPAPEEDGFYSKPDKLEQAIIDGQFLIPNYEQSSLMIARARLLERWSDKSVTGFGSARFQQFIDNTSTTRLGDLQDRKQAFSTAFNAKAADFGALDEMAVKINAAATALRPIKKTGDRTNILAEMAQYTQSLDNSMRSLVDQRNDNLEQLQAAVMNYSNTTTNNAANSMQQLLGNDIVNSSGSSQSEALQTSEYQLQSLLIKEALEGLSSLDLDVLLALAESCPWQYGDAVYKARALYTKFDAVHSFDQDYCVDVIQPLIKEQEKAGLAIVKLYPNPVEDYLLIQIDRGFHTLRPVRVYNSIGQVMKIDWLNGEDNTLFLETNNLKAGVYLIEVYSSDGNSSVQKFIKQ